MINPSDPVYITLTPSGTLVPDGMPRERMGLDMTPFVDLTPITVHPKAQVELVLVRVPFPMHLSILYSLYLTRRT
jgi:hypothetical protein